MKNMKNMKFISCMILILMMFSFGGIVSGSLTVPVLSNESPTNTTTGIDILHSTVNIGVNDTEDTFNWTIEGTYITNAGADGASNGSKTANLITPLPFLTEITWVVNVTDGTNWTNATYSFTTRTEQRLTEHTTDPAQILLVGVLTIVLLLGLVVYVMKSFKNKTFKTETFITLLVAVIVISIALSFL